MTDSAIIAIAAAISIAFSTIGPAMGQGKTAAAAMESIARRRRRYPLLAHHLDGHDGGSYHLRPADRLYARRQGLRGAQL